MRDIGKNIRDLREQKRLTQEELAQALFVTRQTVSNYETGKSRPDVDTVCRIAEVLGVDANTVLYGAPRRVDRQAWCRLGIAAALLAVMAGVYYIFKPICRELSYMQFLVSPSVALVSLWRPLMALVFGWCVMQGAALLLKAKPLEKPWVPKIRWVVLGLLIGCFAALLPFIIFWVIGDFRILHEESVNMTFAYIPGYSDLAYGLIGLNRSAAWVYALVGALLWILGFPAGKRRKTKETENSRCA